MKTIPAVDAKAQGSATSPASPASPASPTEPSSPAEFHIEVSDVDEGVKAAALLARATGLSQTKIKQVMQKGAVWLTPCGQNQGARRLRRGSKRLQVGDTLHLYYNREVLDAVVADAQLIADEGAYSVWYKPYGMRSQGSKWGDHCTIDRFAGLSLDRSAFIVHRLDRAASGLIIIAHQKRVAAAFAALFKVHALEKHYHVIVRGEFPDQIQTFETPIEGKSACSHVSRLDYDAERDCSLLKVVIESGRKHQIRRHLSMAGYPVVGDRLYGTAEAAAVDLQLAAVMLAFDCPVTGEHRTYQLPDDLRPAMARI